MLLESNEVTRLAFRMALRARGVIDQDEVASNDPPPLIAEYFSTLDEGNLPPGWLKLQDGIDYGDMPQSERAAVVWRDMQVVPLDHPLVLGFVAWAQTPGEVLRAVCETALQIDSGAGVHRKVG